MGSTMRLREIMTDIGQIKKNKKPYDSNYYMGFSPEQEFEAVKGEETLVFWIDEFSFKRVYYFSSNRRELSCLLKKVEGSAVLDIVCKGENEQESAVTEAGFQRYAVFCKRQIPLEAGGKTKMDESMYGDFYQPDILTYACPDDLSELWNLLTDTFDHKKDHIPTRIQLEEMIRNKNVVLYKLKGVIAAFYIFRIEGKKLYSNFSYNAASGDILYSLERRVREWAYENRGVSLLYAWFDMKNKRALRRTVLDDTGQRDYVYVMEADK